MRIKVGAVYRKPSSSKTEFIQSFSSKLLETKNLLLIGDMNINLLENENEYTEAVRTSGFSILNSIMDSQATRVDNQRNTRTIIDHVLTDMQLDYVLSLHDHYISDHKVMHLSFTHLKPIKVKQQVYTSKLINFEKLTESINTKLENISNENLSFEFLGKLITSECEKYSTSVIRKATSNISEGWITKDIRNKIKERDKLYIKFKQFPDNKQYKDDFIKIKKEVKQNIKYNKKKHMEAKFSQSISPKKQWALIKELTGQKTEKSSCDELI